jgi:hypothetical protein
MIDRDSISNALRELSDIDVQRTLWLSDGSEGTEVSSFVEAVEQLFTDTGLSDLLGAGSTGLGTELETVLRSLQLSVRNVDVRHGPKSTIDDPLMKDVRAMARQALTLLTKEVPDGARG